METTSPPKRYDLEERTAKFAKAVRNFAKKITINSLNKEDLEQVVRSSGSVAANYIEANNSLGKGDLIMRIRICKKESKESTLWLELLEVPSDLEQERLSLARESHELVCIFGSILTKIGG